MCTENEVKSGSLSFAEDIRRLRRLLICPDRKRKANKKPVTSRRDDGFVASLTTKMNSGGDEGIRTLDTSFGPYAPLAGECLRPLGHISMLSVSYPNHSRVHDDIFSFAFGQWSTGNFKGFIPLLY